MKVTIDVLDPKSIDKAIQQLNDYADGLDVKSKTLCERLASMGATNVSFGFSRLFYTGPVDIEVSVQELGGERYAILASGETVLIAEFGAGVTYGDGHPLNTEFGMGPGTYPGQKHAMDPKGWYLPKAKGGGHTYGNPPTMAMYNTGKDLRREILRVAQEVFKT